MVCTRKGSTENPHSISDEWRKQLNLYMALCDAGADFSKYKPIGEFDLCSAPVDWREEAEFYKAMWVAKAPVPDMMMRLPNGRRRIVKLKRMKRPRKPGGGRKPLLSVRERAQLREAFYCALQQNAQLRKEAAAIAYVRQLLPRSKRGLSDSTLLRQVVRPVLKSK